MTQTFNMTAANHGSRVLGDWIAGRDGAAERAGLLALGENEVSSGGTSMQ